MSKIFNYIFLVHFTIGCTAVQSNTPIDPESFRKDQPVEAMPDGNLLVEAEEFQSLKPGWEARKWGENYYAATFANSFLSRKAYLGTGEQSECSATIKIRVPKDGRYLVLARYEAAYRFETQFRVRVEQKGRRVMDRLYGARKNIKIWAFSQKLKTELAWSWGASENIVWEGHDAFADLQAGEAIISIFATKQPAPAAKRNVDCLLLTTDQEQVKMRIEKEKYLPLDGMLTQAGDVYLKVTNLGKEQLSFSGKKATGGGIWQQHSPYWVHLRNWPKISVNVTPEKSSEWIEVGGTMDTLNDGQWNFTGNGKYRAEFGVKGANGKLSILATFEGEGDLLLAGEADTRYSRRLRRREQVLYDLLSEVKKEPLRGRAPRETLIYGHTFSPGMGAKYDKAATEFRKMFSLQEASRKDKASTYIDVRSVPTAKLAEYCLNLGPRAKRIRCVSLGDEIRLPGPKNPAATEDLVGWLKSLGLKPVDILPGSSKWSAIQYNPGTETMTSQPGVYYWSRRYRHHYGIQATKKRTDILRKHLPNAGIGANYSPHYPAEHRYLGEVHKWVQIFREEGMTMPWSEDYIFQMPVATQQMNNINLDLLRAGVRGKPKQKIHYYCMPHWPGQIPENWRRLFYGALGHGMQVVNLFEFRPVHAAYTENHCSNPETYRTILRSFRELGLFEDIIQSGRKRPAKAALWFSETGDIWSDNKGSFAAGKRTLYAAIIHQDIPLDFIIKGESLNEYRVLFLTDAHVSRRDSAAIAKWVKAGGTLFATANAGMYDELNQPNTLLGNVLGVKSIALDSPENSQVEMVKQDLPFASPIDEVTGTSEPTPVFGVRSRVKTDGAKVQLKFKSNTPALTLNAQGQGQAYYAAFLPGLTYFLPGTPKVPVDRGTQPDSSAHLVPNQFHKGMEQLIQVGKKAAANSVKCSNKLVEANIIDSPKGSVVILTNWSGGPVKELEIELPPDLAKKKLSIASGASYQKENNVIRMDLKVADALILR